MMKADLGSFRWFVRYGTATLFVFAALGLNSIGPARALPFTFFYAAVALSARVCGYGAALFSTVLSAAVVDFFFMPPLFSFALDRDSLLRMLFFGLVALLISSLARQKSKMQKLADEIRRQRSAIVESSEDAIFNKTLEGVVLTWNRAAERLYGYRPDEIIGQNVAILAPPEKVAEIDDILQRLRRGERIAHFETERITKDGRRLYISLSISPVLDEQGTIVEAATIARDITERKRAEAALRSSEERFRAAHAMANVSAFDWNVETGDVTWFTELPALRDLVPDGKFESWMKLIHPEDKSRVEAAIERMLGEGSAELEVRLVRNDGHVIWLSERGELYHDGDSKPHCLGVAMDITERKRNEEVLRRAEKLAAVGQLGATIAHELNNPLEAITNLAYLIRKNKSLDENAQRQLDALDQELARMANMTRRTLGFYRDTSSAVPVLPAEIMDEVLTLYERRLQSKSVELKKEYETSAEVIAFVGEIRKVFSNLIANAIDAVGNRGRITIRIRNSQDWRNLGVPGVRITVADSGSGISPMDKPKIFDPLFTTKAQTGTGLGLWLSKDIVCSHAGSISVRSGRWPGPNCKTAFSVFLPSVVASRSEKVEQKRQTA
ncbi:MAG TPA: PAS domain S-box protein [Terriglobales bacterium]|nr:PAS domain S-box protein [Terriglobales bacterium]